MRRLETNDFPPVSLDILTNADVPDWLFDNIAQLRKLMQLVTEIVDQLTDSVGARRIRPSDAARLLPFDNNLRLWTQTHLTGMILDVTTSNAEAWKHIPKMNGFALETGHGKALLENVGTWENLRKILDMLGPEDLQYTLAILAHIEDITRRKYGTLPDSITGLNPIKIVITDLLRTMGRKPSGNTFSRDQQLRPRRFLQAQSMVEYADIEPTRNGKAKLRIGPLINILNTEFETCLPFEEMPDSGEVLSITVLPGDAVLQLMRKGVRWCHPQLLKYHPLKRKFEIAIGFYVQQLAVNKRNKQDQDYVSIGSIERGSGVDSFDKNTSRRLMRIEEVLNRLANDVKVGISGGNRLFWLEDNHMADMELMSLILDSLKDPVVFVDNDHVVRYMNKTAVERFKDGVALIGRSIFDCHNAESCHTIKDVFAAMLEGEEERLITDTEKHRIYMRAVRDRHGNVIGYYERYEPHATTATSAALG